MNDLAGRNALLRLMDEAACYRDRHVARGAARQAVVTLWECDRGHAWNEALDPAQNVRCMNCTAQRRELETRRLREVAEVRGGALLSSAYVDAATPLTWQCACGHIWDARPDAAARHWCAECARTVFSRFR